jgi:hypothetical protein
MNNFARDRDEIEGALLIPEARAVPVTGNDNFSHVPIATATVTTAVPTSQYDYVDAINANEETTEYRRDIPQSHDNVKEGMTLPVYNACNTDERNRILILQAERKGLAEADEEMEMVVRNNCNINAINYFASKTIEEGNQIAKFKNRMEQLGLIDQSDVGESFKTSSCIQPILSPQKEITSIHNPYGSGGYDIPEYNTNDYKSSTEYDVTEYKSVYEP